MSKNFKSKKINKLTKDSLIAYAIVIIFFAGASLLVNMGVLGSLFKGLLVPMSYYIILAISLNLIVGILGELSLGHAGFMCLGAFAGGLFSILTKEAIPIAIIRFPLALLCGGLVAGIAGVLIAIPILRLKGDYLAIVTLAFGEIIYKIIQNCYLIKDVNGLHFSFINPIPFTEYDAGSAVNILNGAMAVKGVPKDATVLISVIIVLITLFVIFNLINSRAGRAFQAIRDNRIAAESIGVNISKYKLIAFFVSSFFAGVAGTMFSHYNTLDAAKFNYNTSILILVFVVLGGIGNIKGTIIATIILYALPELLREFQTYRMLVYAILLIVMMIVNNAPFFVQQKDKLFAKFSKKAKNEPAKEMD